MIDAIKTVIAEELGISAAALSAESGLDITEKWDSVAQINICLALQDSYDVEFSTEEITTATTVAALAGLVEAKKAA